MKSGRVQEGCPTEIQKEILGEIPEITDFMRNTELNTGRNTRKKIWDEALQNPLDESQDAGILGEICGITE